MDKNYNMDAIRIKIEFTLRLLTTINNTFQHRDAVGKKETDQESLGQLLGDILECAIVLIHRHRRCDGGFSIALSEAESVIVIVNFIGEAFQEFHETLFEQCHGLPITLTFGKQEIALQDCVDKIMKWIDGLYAAEEQAND